MKAFLLIALLILALPIAFADYPNVDISVTSDVVNVGQTINMTVIVTTGGLHNLAYFNVTRDGVLYAHKECQGVLCTKKYSITETSPGQHDFRVIAVDSHQDINDQQHRILNWQSPNHAPIFVPIGDQQVNEGDLLDFTVHANDQDNDVVTYDIINKPLGALFNSQSGEFSWTPNYDQAGIYNVTFIASDPHAGTDRMSVRITVINIDRVPSTPQNTTDLSFREIDNTPTVSWSASTDPDGNRVTYVVQVKKAGTWAIECQTASTNCELGHQTTLSDGPQEYSWHVHACDNSYCSPWAPSDAGDLFAMNAAPSMPINPNHNGDNVQIDPGQAIELRWSPSTNDDYGTDDPIVYDVYGGCSESSPHTLIGHNLGIPSVNISVPQSCDFYWMAVAKDPYESTAGGIWQFHIIVNQNHAPTADAGGPYTAHEAESILFNGCNSTDPDGPLHLFRWNFGDGSPTTNWLSDCHTTHSYRYNGSYTATLEVSDGALSDSDTAPMTILNVPITSLQITPFNTQGCAPITITFQSIVSGGNSPYIYSWDFDDGQGSSLANPTHIFNRQAIYHVALSVTDNDGDMKSAEALVDATQCVNLPPTTPQNTTDLGLRELDNAPIVSWSASTDSEGDPITYEVQSEVNGVWSVECQTQALSCEIGHNSILSDGPDGYHWRVRASDGVNLGAWAPSNDGDLFAMNAPPTIPSNPNHNGDTVTTPPDGTISLVWTASTNDDYGSDDPIRYDVYGGCNSPSQLIAQNLVNPSKTIGAQDCEFYWKVIAKDPYESTAGPIWHFTANMEVVNLHPIANAGGPYSGNEGSTITFNGCGSYDPEGHALTYRWDFQNDGIWDTGWLTSCTATHIYDIAGHYTAKLQVNDSVLTGTDTADVTIDNVPISSLSIALNSSSGCAPLTVAFNAQIGGGNPPFSYLWDFGDGGQSTDQAPVHTYSRKQLYTVHLTVADSDGDSMGANATVDATQCPNQAPTADFFWRPEHPRIDENVRFTSTSSDPDGDRLTYAWDFNNDNRIDATTSIADWSFDSAGSHPVTLTVTDTLGASDSTTKNVVVETPVLNITAITCFPRVVVGKYQSCTVNITSDGILPPQTDVSIYYSDGSLFGTCRTDGLTDACEAEDLQEAEGTFTVYATASADGQSSDTDHFPTFTYQVIAQRYDIRALQTYNSTANMNQSRPDRVFYRSEPLYTKFQVYDLVEQRFVQGVVTSAELVSPPGGRAELESFDNDNPDWYFYKLEPIPPSHSFKGTSQLFAFAFNDTSGGEENVSLEILNNPPVITGDIQNFTLTDAQTLTFDLSSHESDIEDHGSDLGWTVQSNSHDHFVATVNGKTLTIVGNSAGSGTLTLQLQDLDQDTDSKTVSVNVTRAIQPLEITDLVCFDHVIVGKNQSCTVTVRTDGQIPPPTDVQIFYQGGGSFGSCTTNRTTGACETKDIQGQVGNFTIFATAHLQGYESDDDHLPTFTYEVLNHRYDILDLHTYNSTENMALGLTDTVFYRGENLFVSFRVRDINDNNTILPGLVTSATLISPPGGRADLTPLGNDAEWNYFVLQPIPLSHLFKGDSQVFAFAFNFSDGSGGEEQVSLSILNNPPHILTIPPISLPADGEFILDLNPYGFDLEDHGTNLSWSVENLNPALFNATVVDNILHIDPNQLGSGFILLTLADLDGDTDQATVSVDVTQGNIGPHANPGGPYEGIPFEDIHFDGSASSDPDGQIVSYSWDFGDGNHASGQTPTHAYAAEGTFLVTLTVMDDHNATDSANTLAHITNQPFSVTIHADPLTGDAPLNVFFRADTDYKGPITYHWNFGDNKSVSTQKMTYHTYLKDGSYTVTLTATNQFGQVATDSVQIDVGKEAQDRANDRLLILHFQPEEIVRPGDQLPIIVTIKNNGPDLKHMTLTLLLRDLDARYTIGEFDLSGNQVMTRQVMLDIPQDALPGRYDLMLFVGNDQIRRVVYRDVRVQ